VEFAFVAPVFILIVFICIEFCRLNMIRNLTQDAAYYATRHCMVPGATAAEAQQEANRILSAMGTRGAEVVINNNEGIDEDSSEVIVQITVPIGENALFAPKFTGNMDFSATTTMRTERYDGFYDAGL
jgi:Flp pilus assembly protein TadG